MNAVVTEDVDEGETPRDYAFAREEEVRREREAADRIARVHVVRLLRPRKSADGKRLYLDMVDECANVLAMGEKENLLDIAKKHGWEIG